MTMIVPPDTDTIIRYFAIGAMMNPVSVRLRNIHPMSSRPAKLIGHKIHYFGEAGYAEALVDKGCCIHGVVHVIRPDELNRLDVIETGYDKKYVSVETYDDNMLDAFVYCRHGEDIERGAEHDNPPSERYIQILTDGAEAHGVDREYIKYLKAQKVEPRTKPDEYCSFELPDGDKCRVFTREEIVSADGKDGRELLVTVNGKVLKATCSHEHIFARRWIDNKVTHCEMHLSRVLYEPMFGEPPSKLEAFTKAHCDYIEDLIFGRLNAIAKQEGDMKFACVGRYKQSYKDC